MSPSLVVLILNLSVTILKIGGSLQVEHAIFLQQEIKERLTQAQFYSTKMHISVLRPEN